MARHGHGGKSGMGYGMSLETPRKRMRLGLERWSDVMVERQRRRLLKRGRFHKSHRAERLAAMEALPLIGVKP